MIIRRMLAEVVDIVVNGCLLIFEAVFILPMFESFANHPLIYVIFSIGTYIALIILAQGLFWNNNESIGKYFMRLEIASQKEDKEVTLEMMIAREFFVKYITFYLSSIPVIFGKESIQEKVTETVVRRKYVGA